MKKLGDIIIRIGLGLLFVWGGLEKLFIGYFGGVGLQRMANSLEQIGFGFLGKQGNYVLAIWLAVSELIAGILILLNIKTFYASLATVYLPRGNWMQSMIHIALICAYVGFGLRFYKKH